MSSAAVSRREFLKGGGALVVTFGAAGIAGRLATGTAQAQGLGRPGAQLDSWLAIAADGSVKAWTGKCELGQGLYTAQAQLIAEELVVPLERVSLVQCDTDVTPDQGTTSGAQSHHANFNRTNLALAAALAARRADVRPAARPERQAPTPA
jgi:CO/xanthine dehydrogenase Mo-binding subunit